IPGEHVDGNDVFAVMDAVGRAVEHARSGQGPALVECKTFRVRGHSEADKADYVPREVREEWLAKDPIQRLATYLRVRHLLSDEQESEIEARVQAVVDDAVRFAEQSPAPDGATVAEYVFAPDGPIAIVGEPGANDQHYINAIDTRVNQPFNTVSKAEEAVGRR
ncbi:MAG: hypothetical protein J2P36_02240, partial [Ktedonobacteraceae bacterium]|nr:hypothetical protein [Ktedonobacteraceae bacterium]